MAISPVLYKPLRQKQKALESIFMEFPRKIVPLQENQESERNF